MGVKVPTGYTNVAYRIALAGDAEEMLVTMGFRIFSGFGINPAGAELLADSFAANMINLCAAGYTFRGLRASDGPDGEGQVHEVERSVASTSTKLGIPPNTAYLTRKITGLGGRRNRGRFYMPGVSEVDVDNTGLLTATHRTNYQTSVNAWFAQNNAGAEIEAHALFHETPEGAPGIAPTDITSLLVQPKVGTQRRRLRP
jgi:hypothetical protein